MSKIMSILLALAMVIGLVGCHSGPTDEEIIGKNGEQFMLALYSSNDDLAKKICNETGYETFKQLSSIMTMGTFGTNSTIDDAVLIGKIHLKEVKMISEDKGIAQITSDLDDTPKTYSIPSVKDADGNWKVAVTKQSFN